LPPEVPYGYDKYTEFREMARGIKAILYSCWDRVVGRTVAMKTLLPEYANNVRERRRFLREARVTAQLQHPNTVPVYEIGRDDKAGLYFTMKRIAGENYFRVLQRLANQDSLTLKAYSLDTRLDVVIQACQALGFAHLHGVIHRDVKPENIWVGEFGEVILLDWGVSKVWGLPDADHDIKREDDSSDSAEWQVNSLATTGEQQLDKLTQSGQRPGTPLYMSPEQVNGRQHIDERTDIFSMGVLIYEMLVFKEPFRGRNVKETFARIVHAQPVPPSEVQPEAGIPPSLDELVMTAISKKPGDRFSTMLELIEAIRKAKFDLQRIPSGG
jgi:serine/threonine-protein kinase